MDTLLMQKIADLMQNSGLFTEGVNLFIGQLPETIEEAVFLVAASSPPPHEYLDTEEQVVDFWCRSDYTDQAHKKLRAVYNMFHRRANYSLGDWYVYFSNAIGQIQDMDRDRESGKLFKLSVLFECRNVNNVS